MKMKRMQLPVVRWTIAIILIYIACPLCDAELRALASPQSSKCPRALGSSFISPIGRTPGRSRCAFAGGNSFSKRRISSQTSRDSRSHVAYLMKRSILRYNLDIMQQSRRRRIGINDLTELYSRTKSTNNNEPIDPAARVASDPVGNALWNRLKKWNGSQRRVHLTMTAEDGESNVTNSTDDSETKGTKSSNSIENDKDIDMFLEVRHKNINATTSSTTKTIRRRLQRLKEKTKSIVARGSSLPATPIVPPPLPIPMPQAIAAVIRDAAQLAVESAVEDVIIPAIQQRQQRKAAKKDGSVNGDDNAGIGEIDLANVVKLTEAAVEDSIALQTQKAQLVAVEGLARELVDISQRALEQAQSSIQLAEQSKDQAKQSAILAQEASNAAKILQSTLANMVAEVSAQSLPSSLMNMTTTTTTTTDNKTETILSPPATGTVGQGVDFSLSEMAPPFIDESQCLVPGEAVIRIEKAPENSRRIFAGIDILGASVDDVWNVLTDYDNLQKVVPNLVTNRVLEKYEGESEFAYEEHLNEVLNEAKWTPELQCQELATKQKGARLFQVGGAKVVGINFSARTTLDVREWPQGLPDFAHFGDEVYQNKSRDKRIEENSSQKLKRYNFPRPFALCTLPHKDISMQSVANDDGEFRLYQGVWRMQPLPGCAPPGMEAMRLTYAVEISPRPYLPVRLVEGRIAQDLCNNLKAIRSYVSSSSSSSSKSSKSKISSSAISGDASPAESVAQLRP